MAITYTKKLLIERVQRHIANDFPSAEFPISSNEVLLYIDSAIASTFVGSVMGGGKITGSMATPEAYVVTAQLSSLVKNDVTGEWYATLPQTPMSLSLGFSITNAYFGDAADGVSQPIWLIKNKRVAYRDYMPKPNVVSGRVVKDVFYLKAKDNSPLLNLPVYVDMVTTRTTDVNETIAMPDDILDVVFQKVVTMCKDRMNMPKDLIKDDVGQGSSNVSKV